VPEEVNPVRDDQLRLIFTCCHPALSTEAQVALTLRLLGGLSTDEVARSFLVAEPAMAQRLVRAKRKIKAARIPYRVRQDHELPERLPGVLAVVYLIYNAGLTRPSAAALCADAIRLARQPGAYQLQAAINAVHADAATIEQTDWRQIVALYKPIAGGRPDPGRGSQPRGRDR
jgi:predicted RNA polymerase sigma factor